MNHQSGILIAAFPFSTKYKGMDGDRYSPTFNLESIVTDYSYLFWEVRRADGTPAEETLRFYIRQDRSGWSDDNVTNWNVDPVDPFLPDINNILHGAPLRPEVFTDIVRHRKMFVSNVLHTDQTPIDPSVTYIASVYAVKEKNTSFLINDVYSKMRVDSVRPFEGAELIVATSCAGSNGADDRSSGNFSTKMVSTEDFNQIFWEVVLHNGKPQQPDKHFAIYTDKSGRKDTNPYNALLRPGMRTGILKDRNLYVRASQGFADFTLYLFAGKV